MTYHDPITCDECGCFLSRHDALCSLWTEPAEPIDQVRYVLTTYGREAIA